MERHARGWEQWVCSLDRGWQRGAHQDGTCSSWDDGGQALRNAVGGVGEGGGKVRCVGEIYTVLNQD